MKFDKVLFINGNAVGDVILSTAIIKPLYQAYEQMIAKYPKGKR